ncbi:MAG: LytTR family transcriptional regulator DNA-binding domain-containing protein [Lachnospiraceae bacterium]|nr:LytTR family transcriptional regulator DNA-binding domain-containing protein [Lachnospiraceae bacterium]
MIKIAVCDGVPSFTCLIGRALSEWKYERGLDVEFIKTKDSDDLIEMYNRFGHMDLIFMALRPARGPDGVTAARSLKKVDENLRIVFVTAERLVDIEMVSLRPFGILSLTAGTSEVKAFADRCIQDSSRFFIFSSGHGRTALLTDSICYISKKDYPHYRVVIIYCNDGISYMSYMSVREVEAELKRTGAGFIRIQNSCFVNPFYIFHINCSVLRLRQGCCSGDTELYCSRRYGRSAYRAYLEYARKNIDSFGIAK